MIKLLKYQIYFKIYIYTKFIKDETNKINNNTHIKLIL